ncbi:PKD domain-containing protein [Methanosarcina sp. UBA5]|uniref:PKD domain-containing protein n=1 Tax=Methanosarcina sp. UBA5 TaxID=1915593 RepID=UPI0032E42176
MTAPVKPVAVFSASPLSGKAPLKVKFASTSTGSPTEWKWYFGDGSTLVTEQNPSIPIQKPGFIR